MIGLNTSLYSVGIAAAKGIDLAARREQVDASLSRNGGGGRQRPAGGTSGNAKPAAQGELTTAEQRQVDALKSADARVRAHEQAHLAAGGGIVSSGASYTYTYGPDGKAYATAGEVGIDTSKENKPQDNIDKGRLIQAAALAPQDPSPQDRRVASVGAHLEAEGHSDLAQEQAQQRAADAEERQREAAESGAAPPEPESAGNGTRQLVEEAYAAVAAGSPLRNRISEFA